MKLHKKLSLLISHILILFVLISFSSLNLIAQDPENADSIRSKVFELLEKDKYVEALPYLEKLIILDPKDANASFYYGFALLAKAQGMADKTEAKKLRVRAKKAFVEAKKLGSKQQILDGLIESIPLDGSFPARFSKNAEADELMTKGEAAFTQGKYDEALKLYQKALTLDPKLYNAALFSGDMYLRKNEFDNAEIWYQKAIKINPYRETAYRYSATPLMRQKKYDKARDRYVEAFIVEPYSRLATSGIIQWGKATNIRLGHPKMSIPKFKINEKGEANSTISIGSLADDGSMAWIGYTATRTEWHEKKFTKTFPNEKKYRHTLVEETEALRSVIEIAKELKGKKTKLNRELKTLIELDEKGLLEAYILMAIPDNGIAKDHAEYLKKNRDKLRQYVIEYVIEN